MRTLQKEERALPKKIQSRRFSVFLEINAIFSITLSHPHLTSGLKGLEVFSNNFFKAMNGREGRRNEL
jgi:hypothetical protein